MKPFFLRGTKNFGDFTNHWLWPRLLGELIDEDNSVRLVGVGSLLMSELNYVPGEKIIFGSGSGYGTFPPVNATKEWRFYFVRGPLTAKYFGLSEDLSIVDGGWLIYFLPNFKKKKDKKGVAFIPHWKTAEFGSWEIICAAAGLKYIDPTGDFESILNDISSSELVITESLHGAIYSDLFRTPWIPVKISPVFLDFKWLDWCYSVNLPFKLIEIPASNISEFIFYKKSPFGIKYSYEYKEKIFRENIKKNILKNSPPVYYGLKTKIKAVLRLSRHAIFLKVKRMPNFSIIEPWRLNHIKNMSNLLKKISLEKPFLSSESVKNEKLDKLDKVLCKLKNDFSERRMK